jgi:hypothetical protein
LRHWRLRRFGLRGPRTCQARTAGRTAARDTRSEPHGNKTQKGKTEKAKTDLSSGIGELAKVADRAGAGAVDVVLDRVPAFLRTPASRKRGGDEGPGSDPAPDHKGGEQTTLQRTNRAVRALLRLDVRCVVAGVANRAVQLALGVREFAAGIDNEQS